jgi:tRNA(Ile)-lysidine synthase
VYSKYDVWLRRRIVRRALQACTIVSYGQVKEVIERVDRFCLARGKRISLPNRVSAVRTENKVVLFRHDVVKYEHELMQGKRIRIEPLAMTIKWDTQSAEDMELRKQRQSARVVIDAAKVLFPLTVRNIRNADRFMPLGMNGRKKIGDYLTDRKVHPVYRDEIPVVCDREGIIWLVGYEIADRVKQDATTKEVLHLESCRLQ